MISETRTDVISDSDMREKTMGLNDTVSAERIHITFFGCCNAGKSSLVNAVLNQNLSVVSDIRGTTTDPVRKTMELLPLGPVLITDTPGLDDESEIGALRTEKTNAELAKTDIAVVVIDGTVGESETDKNFKKLLEERKIPYIEVLTKCDITESEINTNSAIKTSAKTGMGISELCKKLGSFGKLLKKEKVLVSDLVSAGDIVVLVTPIDEAAPKGRIILPQQMVLRELLDTHAVALVCQVEELNSVFSKLQGKPKLVITDSQAFGKVAKIVPEEILLTSFSILMARYKGELPALLEGVFALKKLSEGDAVLISEACTHHRSCKDIGSVKIPKWIEEFSGVKPRFSFTSGGEFPEDLQEYKLIIHCGGCMINDVAMQYRIRTAKEAGVPMVNYGMAIATMQGVLKRSLLIFGNELIADL